MTKSLRFSEIAGRVAAPASKSMMQRAVAIASLADITHISGITPCDDYEASLRAAAGIGAQIERGIDSVKISARKNPVQDSIDCGEAGLTVRMFSPICALFDKEIALTGRGTLLKRTLTMIEEPLRALGARCATNSGFLPLRICGPLNGGRCEVDGSVSSQFLTGLLIALPLAKSDTAVVVRDLTSRPYIDMTLSIMKAFGIALTHDNYREFFVKGNSSYSAGEYTVEGDWSGASFLLAAGAIGGGVTVDNLLSDSPQADRAFLEVLDACGARVTINGHSIRVERGNLAPFSFDATDCPDLFPPVVALASHCPGESKISGVHRLRHKESDRAATLSAEFVKLGVAVRVEGDTMIVRGGGKIDRAAVDSCGDHRIAMACAVAAFGTNSVTINGAEAVGKSYPLFFEDFAALGAIVE